MGYRYQGYRGEEARALAKAPPFRAVKCQHQTARTYHQRYMMMHEHCRPKAADRRIAPHKLRTYSEQPVADKTMM
jgi:hypothetical protein